MDRTAWEERLGWLEREVSEMSAVIARQDGEIARLRAAVERLLAQGREGGGGVVLGDERPPHW